MPNGEVASCHISSFHCSFAFYFPIIRIASKVCPIYILNAFKQNWQFENKSFQKRMEEHLRHILYSHEPSRSSFFLSSFLAITPSITFPKPSGHFSNSNSLIVRAITNPRTAYRATVHRNPWFLENSKPEFSWIHNRLTTKNAILFRASVHFALKTHPDQMTNPCGTLTFLIILFIISTRSSPIVVTRREWASVWI